MLGSRQHRLLVFLALAWLGFPASPGAAQLPGDANCDGRFTDGDRLAVTAALFGDAPASCLRPDTNGDGRTSAADLVAVFAGPRVTVVGAIDNDGRLSRSLGTLEDGTVVFFQSHPFGFHLAIEAVPAPGGAPIGDNLLDSVDGDPSHRPDLQVQVDRPLGDGSAAVCDAGGVSPVSPPDFALTQAVSNAMNDLACRFDPATVPGLACTRSESGEPAFLDAATAAQFCLHVTEPLALPSDDTRLTVRVRDRAGKVGAAAVAIVRVEDGPFPPTFTPRPVLPTATGSPTATATTTATPRPTLTPSATRSATLAPTRTRTPTAFPTSTPGGALGPPIVFFGIIGSDAQLPPATPGSTPDNVPVYDLPFGFGFSLVIELVPAPSGRLPGGSSFVQGAAPDLQVQVSRPLGNGDPKVCDTQNSKDGVPAIDPPSFADTSEVADRLNDLGCHFLVRSGEPSIRLCSQESAACVFFEQGARFGCVETRATHQFCGLVSESIAFPPGETVVAARVLDEVGNPGAVSRIVIRVREP